MPQSTGTKHQLWNLFGWLQPSPDNLTPKEKDGIVNFDQKNGFADKPKGTTFYFDQITPQEGTLDHLAELEFMAKSEVISPFIELYAEECLAGDTEIPMLNGATKTLKELFDEEATNEWVYGHDKDHNTVACQFERVKLVRENAEILKVHWRDSKGKEGSVKVTPDHKFLCHDGQYVEAQDLREGDKLEGLIRHQYQSHNQTYESLFNRKTRKWQSTHRRVLESTGVEVPEGHVVHHKDHKGLNNSPDNLEPMSHKDHLKLHSMVGEANPRFRDDVTFEALLGVVDAHEEPLSLNEVKEILECGVKPVHRVLKGNGYLNWADFKMKKWGKKSNAFSKSKRPDTNERYEEVLDQLIPWGKKNPSASFRAFRDKFGHLADIEYMFKFLGFSTWNEFKQAHDLGVLRPHQGKITNHTITKIEKCPNEDVFDLINSKPTHNFAVGKGDTFIFVKNCTQPDINTKRTIWFECSDGNIEEELNDMLGRVGFENIVYAISKGLAATGNSYRRILRSEENGIEQLVSVPVTEMERLYDKTTRKLIGFNWRDNEPDPANAIKLGQSRHIADAFAPWEFIHFRRMEDDNIEYGTGLLDAAFPLYKKIKMATDQMVQYRMHMMPSRHAMMIDTGDQSIFESAETVNMFKMLLRNSMVLDPTASRMDSRFNPPAMESMLFFPKRRDEETSIELLAGDKDIPDVYDLEHLWKQLFGLARIPKAYLGFEENTGIAQASLVSQDIRFARMIRVLRKPLIEGVMKLGHLQLAFKGYDPEAYEIKVEMSKISALEEELNAATLERQADMANTLVGICQSLEIPNREIMDLVFKEYLHVPRHFIDLAKLASAVEKAVNGGAEEGDEMMGMGGGGFAGGLGGGMGDFGGDEIGGLEDDLGLGGQEDEEPVPLESRSYSRRKFTTIPLNEGEIKRFQTAIREVKTHGTKLLTEGKTPKQKEKIKKTKALCEHHIKTLKNLAFKACDMQSTRMCSLVEGYTSPNPFLTEDRPKGEGDTIVEATARVEKFARENIATLTTGVVISESQQTHPSVQIKRNTKQGMNS